MNCLICLNGTPPSKSLLNRYISDGYALIAVDGACNYLQQYELFPDVVIGDFDSFNITEIEHTVKKSGQVFKYNSDKDYTDGQLALKYAVENGYKDILIVGALGGRADHEFENYRLLNVPGTYGCQVTILEDDCSIFLVSDTVQIQHHKNCTVSLLPYTDKVHISKIDGFKYAANDLLLSRTDYLTNSGVSNVIIKDKANIAVSDGVLIVFLYKKAY